MNNKQINIAGELGPMKVTMETNNSYKSGRINTTSDRCKNKSRMGIAKNGMVWGH